MEFSKKMQGFAPRAACPAFIRKRLLIAGIALICAVGSGFVLHGCVNDKTDAEIEKARKEADEQKEDIDDLEQKAKDHKNGGPKQAKIGNGGDFLAEPQKFFQHRASLDV